MVVDFVKGVVWGGVVVSAGLVVVSQTTLPVRMEPSAEVSADQAVNSLDAQDGAPSEAAAADVAPAAVEPALNTPKAGQNAAVADAETQVALDAAPGAEAGATTTAPVAGETPALLADTAPTADEPLLQPMAEPETPPVAAVTPEVAALADDPAAPLIYGAPADARVGDGGALEGGPEAASLPQITVLDEAAPAAPEADAGVPDATEDRPDAAEDQLATLVPDSGLGETLVEGVTTGRLPTISAPADPVAGAAPAAVDLPAVKRFARSFENPGAKPLFALLLVDSGAGDVPRAELAALPLPISFVLDPMQPGATEAAAVYRAAGQEVVMLATGIPAGATAADLEQSFAGLQDILPEAVALIDTEEARFQNDRGLSAEVVTHLTDRGLGLVTFDRGLNAADQVARREGLPAATVFRTLDAEGEESPLIRRYLDRAAFKAAQEGQVVVIGTAREATITALMEWAVEGRASSVALAPISAVLTAP